MLQTTRLGLYQPEPSDPATALRAAIRDNATILNQAALDDQGMLSARPASSAGTPGIKGRYFATTDEGPSTGRRLYRDHGTGWDEIPVLRSGDLFLGTIDAAGTYTAAGLRLDNSGYIETVGATATQTAFSAALVGDTAARLAIRRDGRLLLGPGNAAADLAIYRHAAGVAKTDGKFHAEDGLYTDTASVGAAAGLFFGAAADASIGRTAAAELRTPGDWLVGQTLRHQGTTLGFYNVNAVTRQNVVGSRASGAALANLLQAIAATGLITDGTGT